MKKIVFFILLIIWQNTNAQSDEVVFNQFYKALDKLNYSEAMSFYPAIKDALDKRYSYGDTTEFNIRFEMFALAKHLDSTKLILHEIDRIEYLIDKNYFNTKLYSNFLFSIYIFQKNQEKYIECERLLKKMVENQKRIFQEDSQDMAILFSELGFIELMLDRQELSAQTFLQALPILEKYSKEDEIISAKYLLSISLLGLKKFNEMIKYAEECKQYYKKSNSQTLRRSQILNEYRLATAYDSIGNINSSISCSLEFIDLSVQYPENSNESYFGIITSKLPFQNDSVRFIALLHQKELDYWKGLLKISPFSQELKNKLQYVIYQNALYNRSYLEEENENGLLVQYDLNSSLNYSLQGIEFSENNSLENNSYYFETQILLIKNLLDLKDKNLKNELKKATYINKKYFENNQINSWLIENLECEYLILMGDFSIAEKKLLALNISLDEKFNADFTFLNLKYNVIDNLGQIYNKKGDINKYQFYEDKKKKIGIEINQNLEGFRSKNHIQDQTSELSYSDTLVYIADSITSYLQNKSALNLNLNDVLFRLEMDSRRIDLNTKDVLSILNLLEHSYNITQQNVKRKNTLIREKELRDKDNMWNDSIYISFTISMAHVEDQLYNTKESILILEDLKPKVDVTSTNYHRLYNNLAYYYENLGLNNEALKLYETELNRLKQFENNINYKNWLDDYLLTLNNLGELYIGLSKPEKANLYLEEAYLLAKKSYSKNSIQYYDRLKNYVDLIMFSELKQKSEKLLIEENLIAESLFDKNSEDYFSSKKQLFFFYYNNKDYPKTDSLFFDLINTFENNYFGHGFGLNSNQYTQYYIKFLKEFSLFFQYAISRIQEKPKFIEKVLNLYFTMTNLIDKREIFENLESELPEELKKLNLKYINKLQMPIQSGNDLMQLGKLKFSIDSIENIYYLKNTKINGVSQDILSEIKSRLEPNESFVFNILHHELNEKIISIKKDTSIIKYGGTSNYVFVIKKGKPLEFDKYSETDFNIELIASDFQSLTRSNESSNSLKSKLVSDVFQSTLKKIKGSKRTYVFATDFFSWLNMDVLLQPGKSTEKIEETEFIYLTNPIGFNSQLEQFNPKSISLFGASNFNTKLNYFSEKHKPIGIIGVRLNQVVFDLEKKSIIEEVTSGYPASISGLKVGDQIVSINGVKIDTINQFYKVNEMIRGDVNTEVKLEVKRDNIFINFNIIRKDFYLEYQEKYEYLPGTEIEVSSIEKYLKTFNNVEVEKFVGSNSTEDNLKQQLKSEILHIATHSFVVDRDSQIKKYDFTPINGVYAKNLYGNDFFDNGLVFSGVNQFNLEAYNGKLNNGFLYSGEIENLDLSNVKLVVLSACESGIADESIFSTTGGIVNALGKAGAKSAIVSLWKVDDSVTKEFMLCFYKNLIYYKNTSIALRQTKLEIRKTHPEPYYWAPFVLYMFN